MIEYLTKAFWSLRHLKGIKYPYFIFIFFTLMFTGAQIEHLKSMGEGSYQLIPDDGQFILCVIFIAFSRHTINKINFTYILSKFSRQKTFVLNLLLNITLTTIYTCTYLLIHIAFIMTYGFSVELNIFLELTLNTFLYALFCSLFFTSILNLKNKYSTLFVLYFMPVILGLINFFTLRFLEFDVQKIIPIVHNGEHTIGVVLIYIVLFTLLNINAKRPYFFNHE